MKKERLRTLVFLQLLLMVYSVSNVFSKLAAEEPFLSLRFCLYYGGVIALLGVYAIGWQQVIKRLPLTTAFACKAVSVIWGIVWGVLFFRETVNAGKCVGALLIVAGVILFARADTEEDAHE